MDSYYSEEPCDITFTSHQDNRNEDHIDRALKNLKEIQQQNFHIKLQMQKLKINPKVYIKPIRDEICFKISHLRDENESLKRMVDKQKIPAYSQMTKKKVLNNCNNENISQKSSMRGSFQNRNPLDEIDSNYDKNDIASTCLNFNNSLQTKQNESYIIGQTDEQERNSLMSQIRLHLQKAQIVEQELQRINKRQKQEMKDYKNRQSQNKQVQLLKVYQYKKKLVKLLNKLKNREVATNQLVKTYRLLHEETLDKLKQASQNLECVRQAKISQDVDQRYAEVVELQERLCLINEQLQQMDETKWLSQIAKELTAAVRRMGIDIPKAQNIRELIDQLCNILIEAHITTKKDGQVKLNMLKQYHQQQKKNNSKYILMLKSKEQTLGKQLIDIQMSR